MKKVISALAMAALVAGGAFALDITGQIHSGVTLLQGDDVDNSDVVTGGHVGRFRLQASAENEEGTFGAWMRLNAVHTAEGTGAASFGVTGHAWWRPTDMFWMAIGTNPDGFFNAEGRTGWQFHQSAGDARVANTGNFTGIGGYNVFGLRTRDAFFSGFGSANMRAGEYDVMGAEWGLAFTISPLEILNINIGIPFITGAARSELIWDPSADGGLGDYVLYAWHSREAGDVFGALTAQLELDLDFGRIAITYDGNRADDGAIFAYFGMGDEGDLNLDIGLGVHLYDDPFIYVGLGIGVGITEEFGLRARAVAGFGTHDDDGFGLLLDLLPFFSLNDNLTAFLGLGMSLETVDGGDNIFDFHLNPYIQVSAGPASFFAGFRLWSYMGGTDLSVLNWAIPIGITINF